MPDGTWLHWHHAPPHKFMPDTTYFVTAGTLYRKRLFDSAEKMDLLVSTIFAQCETCGWELEAWASFSNHYHLIAHATEGARDTKILFGRIHSLTARALNTLDEVSGRKVWHNYRETALTFEKSYYARLHYVHNNPVHHRVAPLAENYRWCSMGWFIQRAEPTFARKILSFKIDRLSVEDDFDPV